MAGPGIVTALLGGDLPGLLNFHLKIPRSVSQVEPDWKESSIFDCTCPNPAAHWQTTNNPCRQRIRWLQAVQLMPKLAGMLRERGGDVFVTQEDEWGSRHPIEVIFAGLEVAEVGGPA